MKLLLFSDLHCDRRAAEHLVQLSTAADALVGAGDFASVRRNIDATLQVLRRIDRPTVLVAGNNETTAELTTACHEWPSARVLHGSGVTIHGIRFFGIGGGVPVTPFGAWSYDFTETQAADLLRDCPRGAVLVSHSPPKGAVDRSSSGQSLGSTAVREAVLRTRPRLVVCGHIHGSGGQHELLDGVPVVNAGPEGILWELG
jgi:Icc-related predicted phosphoesterase